MRKSFEEKRPNFKLESPLPIPNKEVIKTQKKEEIQPIPFAIPEITSQLKQVSKNSLNFKDILLIITQYLVNLSLFYTIAR